MKVLKEFTLKNGKSLIIEHAVSEDAEVVTNISNMVVKETRFLSRSPEDRPDRVENTKDYIEDCIDSDKDAFLVAKYEGKVVGFGHLDECSSRTKYRHRSDVSLSVLQKYCGLGIGGKLMQVLIELAEKAGYEQIELNVIEENANAVKMYQSFGFEITGKEVHAMKFGEGDYGDYLFMIKFLK